MVSMEHAVMTCEKILMDVRGVGCLRLFHYRPLFLRRVHTANHCAQGYLSKADFECDRVRSVHRQKSVFPSIYLLFYFW